ncbi:hypothetical protein PSPO_b1093 [Pseudoalteromonas spongiae UST010723-006]|nr:hypothetical protein PSPO_b1093 [Pseudoalteromonas spongiae UST010723-006]
MPYFTALERVVLDDTQSILKTMVLANALCYSARPFFCLGVCDDCWF